MGIFSFFNRRRQRESAIPGGAPESLTGQLKGDGTPIGEPVQGVGQPQPPDLTAAVGLGSILGMVQRAIQTGNVQVAQGESRVIDLSGAGLRDEILGAMRQHGIDAEAAQGSQINADNVPELQQQIMQALKNAGVDVSQLGEGAGEVTSEGDDSSGGGRGE